MNSLDDLSKEQLKELIKIFAKNSLALDGVWFQSIEQKMGMNEAMEHDRNAWRRFTEIEARRIKQFLKLPDNSGLDGLERALAYRFIAYANPKVENIREGDRVLIHRVVDCQVQTARKRKEMPFHPCKSVGIIEYTYFAKTIDSRIECEALSCHPDITDNSCACSWKFTLK